MTKHILLIGCLALAACNRQEQANGDSLAAIDTLQPARDTLPPPDSMKAAGATTAATKTKTSPTGSKTAAKRDSIIGRDSVTPLKNTKLLPPAKRP